MHSTQRIIALSLVLAAPCLLTPSAAALQALPGTPSVSVIPSATATFTRCVAGELSGDLLPEVAILRGSEVLLAFGPGLYDAVLTLPRPANDLAVLPAAIANAKGTLLLVNSLGLQRVTFDASTDGFTTTNLATGDWADALLVRVADLDGDGDQDIVGLKSNRRDLLFLIGQGGVYSPFPGFSVPQDVFDAVPFDRNGDGICEIGLRSATAVAVFDAGGALLAYHSVAPGGASSAIARVREGNVDELAWVYRPSSAADQVLRMLRASGLSSTLAIGPKGVVAMASGDFDGDADVDLLLSQQDTHDLLLHVHTSTGTGSPPIYFGTSVSDLYPVPNGGAGSASGNLAWPVFVDVDLDGDLDLAQPVQQTSDLFVFRTRAEDEGLLQPTIDAESTYFTFDGSAPSPLTFDVIMPTANVSAATHIEYTLWKKPSAALPTEAAAVSTKLYTLHPGVTRYTIAIDIPEPGNGFTAIYFFTQRLVTGGTSPTNVFPGSAFAFFMRANQSSQENEDYAVGLTGSGPLIVIPTEQVEGGIIIDTRDIGVVVPEPDVPDTEEGKTPKPAPDPVIVP